MSINNFQLNEKREAINYLNYTTFVLYALAC